MTANDRKSWQGTAIKFLGLLVAGMVFGYLAGSFFGDRLEGAASAGSLDTSGLVALVIALFYIVMGTLVGAGTIVPGLGARILNTYGEEELRDDRGKLLASSLSAVGFGLALSVLVLFSLDILSAGVATVLFFGLLLAGLGAYRPLLRRMDELDRQMSHEAVTYSYYALFAIGGSWAALAHLGLVEGPAMLDWLSLFWGLMLVSTVIAAGRKGLLDKS